MHRAAPKQSTKRKHSKVEKLQNDEDDRKTEKNKYKEAECKTGVLRLGTDC